jgi:protease-4
MFTTTRPFSDEEWARLNTWLDRIYADFTSKVADARGLSMDQVHDVARGRVWTGADAAANGLVDHLGGLETAVALARRKAELPDTAPLRLFPRTHPLDRLRPPESSEDRAAAAASLLAGSSSVLAESWGPVWRLAAEAGLPALGPLQLAGHWVIH